jgi:hypothetical protein
MGDRATDAQAVIGYFDALQFGDLTDIDQHLGRVRLVLQIHQQVGAAGQWLGICAVFGQKSDCLFQSGGRYVFKWFQVTFPNQGPDFGGNLAE